MSNSASARDAGALLEDAIAAVILDEVKDQRWTAIEIQNRSGIKSRTWGNQLVSRSSAIPMWVIAAIGDELGLTATEIVRRAEAKVAALDQSEVELLRGMSGKVRMQALRRRPGRTSRDAGGAGDADDEERGRRAG